MKQSLADVQKRHQQLLELLEARGSLKVAEASELFHVSSLTIRRDFDELEEKGYIARYHGGANFISNNMEKAPVFENKDAMHQQQKQLIAKAAASFVQEKDIVFLNAGTTTLEIIKYIRDQDITIITNNALACTAIGQGAATLISTGGEYNKRNKSYAGASATSLIDKVSATVCILGANGIHHRDGVTTYAYLETMINEEMIKHCLGKRIVVADGSKVGRIFCYTSVPIHNIDILITDSSANAEELDRMRGLGITVILADQE